MIFLILLFIFFIAFLFINYAMCKFGLFAKLSRKFKTSETVKNVALNERHTVSVCSVNKTKEYRYWLIVQPMEEGVFIGQTYLLNFFPLKMLIPWEGLNFINKEKVLFTDIYTYQINIGDQIVHLSTKKALKKVQSHK